MAKKSALVLLSEGSEEMEFVISVDVLRRAGVDVTVAGVQGKNVHDCSRQVKIMPDMSLEEATEKSKYDVVVLPGGLKGSETFAKSNVVGKLLKDQEESGRVIAAICAAPIALKAHKICLGKKLTGYPSVKDNLTEGDQYSYQSEKVVVDGNLITSQGPGTAFEFALAVAEKLVGKDAANTVSKQMLL
ncbi:hypothetical protein RUM43_014483 [Polyplax serrata]|uniref:DJ-1/PfpI domain-containing protein n=1 Tax=Polyplax serrata TaxID=468196 RepID=A0AAN8S6U2_POLSC